MRGQCSKALEFRGKCIVLEPFEDVLMMYIRYAAVILSELGLGLISVESSTN